MQTILLLVDYQYSVGTFLDVECLRVRAWSSSYPILLGQIFFLSEPHFLYL